MKYGQNLKYLLVTGLGCLAGCNASNDHPKTSISSPYVSPAISASEIKCRDIIAKMGLAKAFPLCLEQAQAGDSHAKAWVGIGYYQGEGVAQYLALAEDWLNQSARDGDPLGQYKLAMLALSKEMVSAQDPLTLLIASAKTGYAPAQSFLGKIYHEGLQVEQNDALAFHWYLASAKQNDPQACYEVGMAYIQGLFAQTANPQLGLAYLQKAGEQHYYPAQYALAELQSQGVKALDSVYEAIEYLRPVALSGSSQAQVKLAQALISLYEPQYDLAAFHWLEKANAQQDPQARYLLGTFYYDGIGTEINYPKAFELFLEMAEKNHALAQFKLGQMFYYGQGTPVNITLAREWLVKAAQANVEEAKILMAIFVKEDLNAVSPDSANGPSKEWIEFAASTGDPTALYLKGLHHLQGEQNFEKNIELGMMLISQAAEQHVVAAQRQLAQIYGEGLFGLTDENKAYDWALIASKNADSEAQLQLANMFYTGKGAPADLIQAYAWAQSALILGHAAAAQLRDEVADQMTISELAQANSLSLEYSQKSEKQTLSYHD